MCCVCYHAARMQIVNYAALVGDVESWIHKHTRSPSSRRSLLQPGFPNAAYIPAYQLRGIDPCPGPETGCLLDETKHEACT
jgi:hypothetical protein